MSYIDHLIKKAKIAVNNSNNINNLEKVRLEYFGKNGHITLQIARLRTLDERERLITGSEINRAKESIKNALTARKDMIEVLERKTKLDQEYIDVSLPGRQTVNGGLHPITCTINCIETFFSELGFIVKESPDIEDCYHNFDALNIPYHHPARSEHDTFWFDSTRLLRTQTSGIQIHTMKQKKPPIRMIAPGRVYRNDYDRTHTPMFHQMEGLLVEESISFAHLKGILFDFLKNFFEDQMPIRFRASYFPFTEPSAEVDIMAGNGQWLEVLGCGMVHPNVMNAVGINPMIYSGFAFGMGMERLTMLRYGVIDSRDFFENDLCFLKQFQ
ncbi:Phenylalanine--tRNA ligase alpha subunit [Candidatus Erwinia haradaeae]|uniref:Phenylalanine--tRNA ligase alpha subunit n=1 Tax=Candidatus Erwinia haradaeae TaxID=1922217 RepID=A0A451CZP9_9GAMM|nr:phenylalanine--tRNA ligase subunit alpha [Candidatus Erwinia haradaeae]VFP78500.1 Phenylalanine--tRNA ligase alpha subunit [Candidatus Erwinia haradaeae]